MSKMWISIHIRLVKKKRKIQERKRLQVKLMLIERGDCITWVDGSALSGGCCGQNCVMSVKVSKEEFAHKDVYIVLAETEQQI